MDAESVHAALHSSDATLAHEAGVQSASLFTRLCTSSSSCWFAVLTCVTRPRVVLGCDVSAAGFASGDEDGTWLRLRRHSTSGSETPRSESTCCSDCPRVAWLTAGLRRTCCIAPRGEAVRDSRSPRRFAQLTPLHARSPERQRQRTRTLPHRHNRTSRQVTHTIRGVTGWDTSGVTPVECTSSRRRLAICVVRARLASALFSATHPRCSCLRTPFHAT